MSKEEKGKKSFVLRLDPRHFELLQEWAKDEFRSINGQMEFVLHEALKKAGRIKKEK